MTITQWVSDFVYCMQEEKSEQSRTCMLDYLGNIMEDASDFSWDSAKAYHAVVLTSMEADRLSWTDVNCEAFIESTQSQLKGSSKQHWN